MSENGNGNGHRLRGKQQAFVNAWFGEAQFNGTEAARIAGYSGGNDPDKERDVWAVQASQVLGNTKVQDAIKRRWAIHGMTAEEVISRLAAQGRGNIADYLTPFGAIDWAKVKEAGHIIRKVAHRKGEHSSIELYDAQSALVQIGRTMGLFVDRQQHEGTLNLIVDWDSANHTES